MERRGERGGGGEGGGGGLKEFGDADEDENQFVQNILQVFGEIIESRFIGEHGEDGLAKLNTILKRNRVKIFFFFF